MVWQRVQARVAGEELTAQYSDPPPPPLDAEPVEADTQSEPDPEPAALASAYPEALGELEEDAIRWVLENGKLPLTGLAQRSGLLVANRRHAVSVAGPALEPGRYVTAIRFTATMNPERSATLISDPFTVR